MRHDTLSNKRLPALRSRRLPSGACQFYAKFAGRQIALGTDREEAERTFRRALARYVAAGPAAFTETTETSTEHLTVAQVIDRFLAHERARLRLPSGVVRKHFQNIAQAASGLRDRFHDLPARKLTAKHLMRHQQALAAGGLVRSHVNSRVAALKRLWRWAVVTDTVPDANLGKILAVANLEAGEFGAKESTKRQPVEERHVRATFPFLGAALAAVVELQLITGARPTEVLSMKPEEIDRSKPVQALR